MRKYIPMSKKYKAILDEIEEMRKYRKKSEVNAEFVNRAVEEEKRALISYLNDSGRKHSFQEKISECQSFRTQETIGFTKIIVKDIEQDPKFRHVLDDYKIIRSAIAESNIKYILSKKVPRVITNENYSINDFINEMIIVFMKSIDNFIPSNIPFNAYMKKCLICGYYNIVASTHDNDMHVSRRHKSKFHRENKNGAEPVRILKRVGYLKTHTREFEDIEFEDIFSSKFIYDELYCMIDDGRNIDIFPSEFSITQKLVDSLTEREQIIIQKRFGFIDGEEKSLQEIGDELGLTKERVRQLESQAMSKMKKRMDNYKYA